MDNRKVMEEKKNEILILQKEIDTIISVSYTHLDVYKRQDIMGIAIFGPTFRETFYDKED